MKKNGSTPNYKKIYTDIILKKHPQKILLYFKILKKNELSALDVIEIDKRIFGNKNVNKNINGRLRAYNETEIIEILRFQKENQLSNTKLALQYKLSRNTVAKWKKLFGRELNTYQN